jgi:hypothetical protein
MVCFSRAFSAVVLREFRPASRFDFSSIRSSRMLIVYDSVILCSHLSDFTAMLYLPLPDHHVTSPTSKALVFSPICPKNGAVV